MIRGKFIALGIVYFTFTGIGAGAQVLQDSWPDNAVSKRPGQDCQNVSVLVRDQGGLGISGATVRLEGLWEATTDLNGVAVFDCRLSVNFPAMVEVTAPGYKPSRVPVGPMSGGPDTVDLERLDPQTRYLGEKVDVRELSPEVREKSERLVNESSRAIAQGDYDGAKQLLQQALQLTPSSAPIYNNLGVAYLHTHDIDGAASWFEKAVKAAPYDASIAGNLGLVRWIQHRPEESYAILLRADAMGYESAGGHYVLGVMSLQKGLAKKAVEHLKKIPPEKFPYRDLYLSLALRACGRTKAAEESYQSFLRRDPVVYMPVALSN